MIAHVTVTENRRIGEYRVLAFRAPGIAAAARPGQFVNIAPPAGGHHVLRRPFSVYLTAGEEVSIAFDAIGDGTRWLATREPGDVIGVVGPLGHGFDLPELPGVDAVVGGGYGTAALSFLARELVAGGGTVHGVIGARYAARVFDDEVIDAACATVTVTTDDGSAGHHGVVTDVLPALVAEHGVRTVYACGPMPMLEAVARACEGLGVPSRVAVEEFMACGIGVCWTCVLPVRSNGSVRHLRSCTEGPVFEGASVAWA